MRTIWNLNKDWFFALEEGIDAEGKDKGEHLQYEQVSLPHDWMITRPFNRKMKQREAQGFRDRWGIGWYRRTLQLSKEADKIYRLCFDGVYENSTVWVNDVEAGGRKYGYSGFALDITEALKDGKNVIVVKVDNTSAPVDRWYTGAGIYRKVTLECLPKEFLEKTKIFTEVNFPEGFFADAEASGADADTQNMGGDHLEKLPVARVTIHTGTRTAVKAILPVGSKTFEGTGTEKIELDVNGFSLWSAKQPVLYELTLQLVDTEDQLGGGIADEITLKIGFRKIELSADKGLFINGVPTKLKGVCVHQDAGCFGTAVTKEVWRERLIRLMAMGCNAVRLAHHLYMPEMLDLCDELGFYVYEEAFDKWTGGAYGRYYETEWANDLTYMVRRDRNHPSILFWGVGNEVENQSYPSMLKMLEKHVAAVKQWDLTRPVSLAINPHFAYPAPEVDMSTVEDIQQFVDEMKSGEIFDVNDRVAQIAKIAERVDFISCNYQEQWYDLIHKAVPEKPVLGTETYMYFRGFAEKFQNFTMKNPWHDVTENDFCMGGFIWTGIDYWGESLGYPAKGWSGALFADDMEKKPMAWQMQSYWKEEPMVHFAVMDYSIPDEGTKEHWDYPRYVTHWEFPQFHKTVVPYMIATNCQEVELHVNEKEYSVTPVKEFENKVITGFVPYFPGEVTVIGKNAGKEVCRHTLVTPGMAVKLGFEKEEQSVTLERAFTDSGREEVQPYRMLCRVRAFDEEDTPVFRESGKVEFVVEGPAQLIGVGNGDIKSAEPVDNDFVHLFRGRAYAAICITGTGRVRVTAFAAGMAMAQCVIAAQ